MNTMDLFTAVKIESLEKIKEIVTKQGIPSDSKWTDYKILNICLSYGRKDVAVFLLDQKCRVNKTKKSPSKENTPLHHAVKLGDVQIVKKLLEKQASVLAIDQDKNTPLHLAFINKHDLLVDLILENIQQFSNHINLKNNQGLSHFHIACTAKNGQTIQGFLDAGADVNEAVNEKSPCWAGFTAVHFAVNFKCLEALNILLKIDAEHETKTCEGKTPLDLAYQKVEDWLIIIDILKKKSLNCFERSSLSNFHVACLREDEKVVEKFIKHGIEVNSKYGQDLLICDSSSSLHWAVISECKKKVELLLKHGSKLDSKDSNNTTPLHLAVYNEQFRKKETTEIVDLLYNSLENKMIEQEDDFGISLFHVAITRNDVATVKQYLDEKKADVNKVILRNPHQSSDYSPLHLAVKYQYPEMVKLLMDYGADINAYNEIDRETPIHVAFKDGAVDIIDILLKNDVNVDLLQTEDNLTLLHALISSYLMFDDYSRRGSQLYKNKVATLLYIEHLIKLGIDINAKDKFGNIALHEFSDMLDDDDVSCYQLLLNFGADINVENCEGYLPFEFLDYDLEETCDTKFYTLYYHHVQKLKAIDLYVHPKNEEFCKKIAEKENFDENELSAKQQQRLDEIAKLKSIKLGKVTTLCDFLKLDPRRAALFAQCKTLKKIAMDSALEEKFPVYGYLIQVQFNMAVKSHKNKCQSVSIVN